MIVRRLLVALMLSLTLSLVLLLDEIIRAHTGTGS